MKLFMTERPSAMAAVRFPVPTQAAHAFAVGLTSVPGISSVLMTAGQACIAGQESVQRIRIQGRVLADVKGINGFTGGLDMAEAYDTRPGAVKAASGVPPRGRPV